MTGAFRVTCAGALIAACVVAACDDASRPFLGRFFLESRDCLGTVSSIDVVPGEASRCAPACLVQRTYDGGRPVYVTTECAPYPPDTDGTGVDPRCAAALDAFTRGDTCLPDGGSSRPRPPAERDAGALPDGG